MNDKSIKIRKDECDTTTEPVQVDCIDDFCKDDHITDNGYVGNDDNGDTDTLDDLMITQSKAQIRSDYRRSLGKEFVRRLK